LAPADYIIIALGILLTALVVAVIYYTLKVFPTVVEYVEICNTYVLRIGRRLLEGILQDPPPPAVPHAAEHHHHHHYHERTPGRPLLLRQQQQSPQLNVHGNVNINVNHRLPCTPNRPGPAAVVHHIEQNVVRRSGGALEVHTPLPDTPPPLLTPYGLENPPLRQQPQPQTPRVNNMTPSPASAHAPDSDWQPPMGLRVVRAVGRLLRNRRPQQQQQQQPMQLFPLPDIVMREPVQHNIIWEEDWEEE
jgi:hypothetical protein